MFDLPDGLFDEHPVIRQRVNQSGIDKDGRYFCTVKHYCNALYPNEPRSVRLKLGESVAQRPLVPDTLIGHFDAAGELVGVTYLKPSIG